MEIRKGSVKSAMKVKALQQLLTIVTVIVSEAQWLLSDRIWALEGAPKELTCCHSTGKRGNSNSVRLRLVNL